MHLSKPKKSEEIAREKKSTPTTTTPMKLSNLLHILVCFCTICTIADYEFQFTSLNVVSYSPANSNKILSSEKSHFLLFQWLKLNLENSHEL